VEEPLSRTAVLANQQGQRLQASGCTGRSIWVLAASLLPPSVNSVMHDRGKQMYVSVFQ
jgi:hypothetical protein